MVVVAGSGVGGLPHSGSAWSGPVPSALYFSVQFSTFCLILFLPRVFEHVWYDGVARAVGNFYTHIGSSHP